MGYDQKIRLSMPLDFETSEDSFHWYHQIFKWWVVGTEFTNNNRLNFIKIRDSFAYEILEYVIVIDRQFKVLTVNPE